MSVAREVHEITQFLKKTLLNSGQKGYALGLSGGIDSAVCAALAQRAIDEINNGEPDLFTRQPANYILDLIILPMGNVAEDADVAYEVAEYIGAKVRTVNLGNALSEFEIAANLGRPRLVDERAYLKTVGNLKARLRMAAIYFAANENGLLVLGTDNLAETYTGYFTKHGDGAADVFPLSDFSKREVYELGAYLGLPHSVLTRAPSAGLWEGQTDEDELGVPYNFIDNVVEGVFGANVLAYTAVQCRDFGIKLRDQHSATEHKRSEPYTFRRKHSIDVVL